MKRHFSSLLLLLFGYSLPVFGDAIYAMTGEIRNLDGSWSRDTRAWSPFTSSTSDTVRVVRGNRASTIPGFDALTDTNFFQESKSRINKDFYNIEVYNELEFVNWSPGQLPAPGVFGVDMNYAGVTTIDQITVTNGTGYGYFSPVLALHGALYNGQWPIMKPWIGVSIQVNGQAPVTRGQYGTGLNQPVYNVYTYDSVPELRIEYGVPFTLQIDLYSWIHVDETAFSIPTSSYSGMAQANFFDSLRVLSLQVRDESGNVNKNAQFTSQSGIVYSTAAVPEASESLLFLCGLVGVVVFGRRRFLCETEQPV